MENKSNQGEPSPMIHTGLALNMAGVPTLFIHPYTVQASVWLWNQGITPALINNSYHLQNETY